jgi:hypothetical protein
MAGQHATAFANGKIGLSLGGSGALAPIEQGKPRAPSVERVPVPRGGFTAIRHATNGQGVQPLRNASVQTAKPGVTRISSSIGEVRLNVHRVTNGLAHDKSAHGGARNAAKKDTVWGSSGSGNDTASASDSQSNAANSAGATSSVSSTVAAVSGKSDGSRRQHEHGRECS